MSAVSEDTNRSSSQSDRTKSKASMGIRLAFIDRKKVIDGKCIFCNKRRRIFGFIIDRKENKEGLACEGCIESFF